MSRKKNIQRRQTKRTILLVTNGHITEKSYLDGLKRIANQSKKLHVETKPLSGLAPENVLKKLTSPQGDATNFDEVWIIVDHDGTDRTEFLRRCDKLSSRTTKFHGVVSVPCFEVWLIAHYQNVGMYPDQDAAKRALAQITQRHKDVKELPDDFPWDDVASACHRSHLTHEKLPAINTQGGPSTTGMPHLIYSLGLS